MLKLSTDGLTLPSIAGIAVGILLSRAGQPGWAAGAGLTPSVIMATLLAIELLK